MYKRVRIIDKVDCQTICVGMLIHIIPAYSLLSEDDAKKYYQTDEGNKYYRGFFKPHKLDRYVVQRDNGYNMVIPVGKRFEVREEE